MSTDSQIVAFIFVSDLILLSCNKEIVILEEEQQDYVGVDSIDYFEIPQPDIYEVSIKRENDLEKLIVFQPTYHKIQLDYMYMIEVDQYPLDIFQGRTNSWTNFFFPGSITVEVKVLGQSKVPVSDSVIVLPSHYGIYPEIKGSTVHFTLSNTGHFSMENGYESFKNGLVIFADDTETNFPGKSLMAYKNFTNNSNNSYCVESTFSMV